MVSHELMLRVFVYLTEYMGKQVNVWSYTGGVEYRKTSLWGRWGDAAQVHYQQGGGRTCGLYHNFKAD